MKKIKIYNDGNEPKLKNRIILMQLSLLFSWFFFDFHVQTQNAIAIAMGIFPVVAMTVFED